MGERGKGSPAAPRQPERLDLNSDELGQSFDFYHQRFGIKPEIGYPRPAPIRVGHRGIAAIGSERRDLLLRREVGETRGTRDCRPGQTTAGPHSVRVQGPSGPSIEKRWQAWLTPL